MERGKEKVLSYTGSLTDGHGSQGSARLTLGIWNSTWVIHIGGKFWMLRSHLLVLPAVLAGIWKGNEAVGTTIGAHLRFQYPS